MSYQQTAARFRKAKQASASRGSQYNNNDTFKQLSLGDFEKNQTIDCLILASVKGKWHEQPFITSTSKIEISRQPVMATPAYKDRKRLNFSVEEQKILTQQSSLFDLEDENGRNPYVIDAIQAALHDVGAISESKGCVHSSPAVKEAMDKLLPVNSYKFLVLARCSLQAAGSREYGGREYTNYKPVPHKEDDVRKWTPLTLQLPWGDTGERLMGKFVGYEDDKGNYIKGIYEKFLEETGYEHITSLKKPVLLRVGKDDKGHYTMSLHVYKPKEPLDRAFFRELEADVPDQTKMLKNMVKLDPDEVLDILKDAWFYKKMVDKYPDFPKALKRQIKRHASGEAYEEGGSEDVPAATANRSDDDDDYEDDEYEDDDDDYEDDDDDEDYEDDEEEDDE